jgi:hypothetical protein
VSITPKKVLTPLVWAMSFLRSEREMSGGDRSSGDAVRQHVAHEQLALAATQMEKKIHIT